MRSYALYSNGEFVIAKPFYQKPQSPEDFGIGALPTSTYIIVEVEFGTSWVGETKRLPATIDVGN